MRHVNPGRFFAKVDKNGPIPAHRPELGPCHLWTGYVDRAGYGKAHTGSRTDGTRKCERTHRVAFYLAHGRWPEPCALHHCDNRACVNVAHLFEGTQLENISDRHRKGRDARGNGNASAKLAEQDVRDIRANYVLCRVTMRELSKRFGVSKSRIVDIVGGKAWAHVV